MLNAHLHMLLGDTCRVLTNVRLLVLTGSLGNVDMCSA